MEETSHSFWVNSKAYEMAGITEDVKNDVERGIVYMRDSNGRLNGIVLENAGIQMMEKAMDPRVEKIKIYQYSRSNLIKSFRNTLSLPVSPNKASKKAFTFWPRTALPQPLMPESTGEGNTKTPTKAF